MQLHPAPREDEMTSIGPHVLTQQLQWRYATKLFDPSRQIPSEYWSALEQALILTPSSFGMQPWKFIVLHQDTELRERLVACSWGQRQVADSSHYVVFAVRTEITADDVDQYLNLIATVRQVALSSLEPLRQMIHSNIVQKLNAQQQLEWASRQAYIALGNFMTSAALLGIDACPMEGINPAKYDEILGLQGSGWATCVGCAAGYRIASDKYAALAKVRYPAHQVIEHR